MAGRRRRIEGPARANVEHQVWSDPRFRMLALRTKLDVFSVVGRVARLWAECTGRNIYAMAADEVDLFAEWPGFAEAMVASKLARPEGDALYICGTRGRIEWFANMLKQRSDAGIESARKRAERAEQALNGPATSDDEDATGDERLVKRLVERSVERSDERPDERSVERSVERPSNERSTEVERNPSSAEPDPRPHESASESSECAVQAPLPPIGDQHEVPVPGHDAPADGSDEPAAEDERGTTCQRPVERPMNEMPTSDERRSTSGSGSGSGSGKSSPPVKTGESETPDHPGLFPSEPNPKRQGSASPPARARTKPQALPLEPMPYTVAELLVALRAGSDGLVVIEPFDSRMGPPITALIREGQRQDVPVTLADARLAGEYMAANWRPGLSVGPEWVATSGKFLGTVGKARDWAARGRPAQRASPTPVAGSGGKVRTPEELAARARELMEAERKAGHR